MLRRDRQIKTQVYQLIDACLFALSFWLAYQLRSDVRVIYHFRLHPLVNTPVPLEKIAWIFPVLMVFSPLVLEARGFYSRPTLSSRRVKYWQLAKGCLMVALGLILALYFSKLLLYAVARWIPVWFGGIAFCLVVIREKR